VKHNAKTQKLSDFESTVLTSIWDEAQDMLFKGGVTDLTEVEKQFWISRVFDGTRSYEVEILLDGRRFKGFTCDCWSDHRSLMCKHVAAAAAALRQYLQQRDMERKAKKLATTPADSGDKLNISTIIKRTPPEALAEFIQEYASEDKAFATLLKSRFASWLSGGVNYYRQILNGLIPEKHTGNLSPTEQRKVQRIVDDLVRQQKGATAEHDLQKAWLINTGIIDGLPRLVGKMHEMYREPYHQIFQNAYLFVLRLSADQMSPEMWDQRRVFIFELLEHKFLNDSALRLIMKSMETDADFWRMVEDKFNEVAQPISIGLLTAYAAALVRRKMGAGLTDVIRHFVPERDMAVRLVLQLYHLNHLKEALLCGALIAEQTDLTLVHKNTMGQIMLSAATKLGDTKRVMQLLGERFYASSNMEYYDQMREASGEKWSKNRDAIIKQLVKLGDYRLLCTVYMHEKEFDLLFGTMRERADFHLVHQLEKPLITHKPKELADTYVHICDAYLQEHYGNPSADFVKNNLMLLLKLGGAEVGKIVAQKLAEKYAERTALLEAFADIFPKHRRMIKPFVR
jgi:hypothetical protein